MNSFGRKEVLFTPESIPDLIRLDYADCKYPPSENVIRAIKQEAKNVNLYPPEDYSKLLNIIAKYNNVDTSNLILSNGSDELIDLIIRVFGRTVLIPIPTFSQYERFSKINGSNIILRNCLKDNEYILNFRDKDLKRASLIFICDPNNPTGNIIPKQKIEYVIKNTNAVVVVDECYFEYTNKTCSDLVYKFNNLIILRSLSKTFGLAGLRLGYAISNKKIIDDLLKIKQVFNVNRLATVAAIAVLKDIDYYKGIIKKIEKNRKKLAGLLKRKRIKPFPSETNFLLVKFKSKSDGLDFCNNLRRNGILVFSGSSPDFSGLDDSYIRITVGTEKDNNILMKVLDKIL